MVYDAGILGTLHGGMISIPIAIGIGFAMSDLSYTNFTNSIWHLFEYGLQEGRMRKLFNATY